MTVKIKKFPYKSRLECRECTENKCVITIRKRKMSYAKSHMPKMRCLFKGSDVTAKWKERI